MILFAVFVFMQNEGKDILHISSTKVVQEVSKNADIIDVWEKKYHRGVDLRPLVKN